MEWTRRQFAAWGAASLWQAGRALAQPPTVTTRDVAWLGEIQKPPAQLPPAAGQLMPLLADADGNKIRTLKDWQRRQDEMRGSWLSLLGMWERPLRMPEFTIIETDRTPYVSRQLIRYETERGVEVEAFLLMPTRRPTRLPAVVVFHSTVPYTIRQGAGLEGPAEAQWGIKLAERGFVVLCPRCFLWDGAEPIDYMRPVKKHKTRHFHSTGMAKMLFDGMRAVDVLAGMREVDPQRIGAAGHSLGAKEALYLAAFDTRVRAAVSSEGGIGTSFSNWDAPWYLGTKQFGREHHELLGLAAPRPFLLIGGESADGAKSWPYIAEGLEVYRLYGQPARLGLYNHGQGHTIPPSAEARTYEWLETYL